MLYDAFICLSYALPCACCDVCLPRQNFRLAIGFCHSVHHQAYMLAFDETVYAPTWEVVWLQMTYLWKTIFSSTFRYIPCLSIVCAWTFSCQTNGWITFFLFYYIQPCQSMHGFSKNIHDVSWSYLLLLCRCCVGLLWVGRWPPNSGWWCTSRVFMDPIEDWQLTRFGPVLKTWPVHKSRSTWPRWLSVLVWKIWSVEAQCGMCRWSHAATKPAMPPHICNTWESCWQRLAKQMVGKGPVGFGLWCPCQPWPGDTCGNGFGLTRSVRCSMCGNPFLQGLSLWASRCQFASIPVQTIAVQWRWSYVCNIGCRSCPKGNGSGSSFFSPQGQDWAVLCNLFGVMWGNVLSEIGGFVVIVFRCSLVMMLVGLLFHILWWGHVGAMNAEWGGFGQSLGQWLATTIVLWEGLAVRQRSCTCFQPWICPVSPLGFIWCMPLHVLHQLDYRTVFEL